MSKTTKNLLSIEKFDGERILTDLQEVHGVLFPKGIDIAEEIRRKVQDADMPGIWPTFLSANEDDHGLSRGFKTAFGLTPECTLQEAEEVLSKTLTDELNATPSNAPAFVGSISVTGEFVMSFEELRPPEEEIILEQSWGLPAVRISYVRN